MNVQPKDFGVCHVVRISEYFGDKCLASGFVSYFDHNPKEDENDFKRPAQYDPDTQIKKALKMTSNTLLTHEEAANFAYRMKMDHATGKQISQTRFQLHASYKAFPKEMFQGDMPIVDRGGRMEIRLPMVLTDSVSTIPMACWGKAAREMFHLTADELCDLWSRCETDAAQQEFLSVLNLRKELKFLVDVRARIWQLLEDWPLGSSM